MVQKIAAHIGILIFLIFLGSCENSGSSSPTEQEILADFTEQFYEFYETYKNGDISFVDYYAEDVLSMNNKGEVEKGSASYRQIWAENLEKLKIDKLDYTAPEIIFSKDMILTYNDYDERFIDLENGDSTEVRGTWIAVWKKFDTEWKVVMNTFHLKD